MSPYVKTCSVLLKKQQEKKLSFMDNLRKKLEYKKKNTAKGQTSRGVFYMYSILNLSNYKNFVK